MKIYQNVYQTESGHIVMYQEIHLSLESAHRAGRTRGSDIYLYTLEYKVKKMIKE